MNEKLLLLNFKIAAILFFVVFGWEEIHRRIKNTLYR